MASAAILVGNSAYRNLGELACCHDDVVAMEELLRATEKYTAIEIIENAEADELKSRMREAIDRISGIDELFFYFTGHGEQKSEDFYYCATGFDSKRPNETGLSTSELHTILRSAEANLVIKVVDACNSGTMLIKSGSGFLPEKHEFKKLIQISSCLDTQNSLTGDPLSVFTEQFRAAALRKHEGAVYFTDVANTLRDEFLQDIIQTPFFVLQGTGREQFVDNAKRLDGLRAKLAAAAASSLLPANAEQLLVSAPPTLRERLEYAELKIATQADVSVFVGIFFDNIIASVSTSDFAEFFDVEVVEHSDFKEPSARSLIRSLEKENRPDNFVTAKISRKYAKNKWALAGLVLADMLSSESDVTETHDLKLNCTMQRVQLKITLKPKYHALRQIILVVTCAPSLEICYIFEVATQHRLRDFGVFDVDGDESIRRWYKYDWKADTDGLVAEIALRLGELVRAHLESVDNKLLKLQL